MIKLVKQNQSYYVQDTSQDYKLVGEVLIEDTSFNLDATIFDLQGNFVANCGYEYAQNGSCSKSVRNTRRELINTLQNFIEEVVSFLIQRFYPDES